MKHLKIFVWNDEDKFAKKWQSVIAGGDEEQINSRVPVSTAKTLQEIVRAFEDAKPDVVILDIKCNTGDTKMGLKIAEKIREQDLLVPIIAITREPKIVYMATDQIEKLGFAGVFEASVMEKGVFENIVLRQSLNQWHLVAPEFALVRACIQKLRTAFGDSEQAFVNEFCSMIESLPFSGSIESWHGQIRDPLTGLMRRRDLNKIAKTFEASSRLFEQADPFYMAGSHSRRHLSHNVQVFLIGLMTLIGWERFRKQVVKEIQSIRQKANKDEALIDAILIWACIANTHDTAYLSEHLGDLIGRLRELSQEFKKVLNPEDKADEILKINWPTTPHGEITARFWQNDISKENLGFEDHYMQIVADAIKRHDSKHFKNKPVESKYWAQFLAVFSDELQDWGRERLTNPPGSRPFETVTWGLFGLEGIQFQTHSQEGQCIALTFIARDHPEVIGTRLGRDGTETVRKTFARIAQKLDENLRSSLPLKIELSVHFASRPNAIQIVEKIRIRPES